MNLLKLKINGRVDKTFNFDQTWCENMKNNHFIVRNDNGNNTHELISFSNERSYICGNGSAHKIQLSNLKWGEENKTLIIELKATTNNRNKNGNQSVITSPDGIEHTDENGWTTIRTVPPNDRKYLVPEHLVVELRITDLDVDVCQKIHFHIMERVYDAIVDFGSESSQAIWHHNDETDYVDITQGIMTASNLNNEQKENFIQFERDQRERLEFYRSIYYIKNPLTEEEIPTAWPNYTINTVKYLIKNNLAPRELADYIHIPNTKILSSLADRYTSARISVDGNNEKIGTIGEGVIPRLMMNNIIYQTLNAINNNTRNRECAVVLNVLMPNIYPIDEIAKKMNILAGDLETVVGQTFQNIVGVELRYVSESDASFLGYINSLEQEHVNPGNYLIIDAGKGTLDFSLLKVNNGVPPFVNLCRSGIIGAGAAVTYGVLLGLVNEYLCTMCTDYPKEVEARHNMIRKFLFKLWGETDVAQRNATMTAVEKYKVAYNEMRNQDPKESDQDHTRAIAFDELMRISCDDNHRGFNAFVNMLEGRPQKLSARSGEYISATIDKIATTAVNSMATAIRKDNAIHKEKKTIEENEPKERLINYVVFSGRGCLMTELRESILNELKGRDMIESENAEEIVFVLENAMKNGCLNINNFLIGNTYTASASNQMIYKYYPIAKQNVDNTTKKRTHLKASGADQNINQRLEISTGLRPQQRTGTSYSDDINNGINIGRIEGAATKLYIGGHEYGMNDFFRGPEECTLYFDGINYWITSAQRDPSIIRRSNNILKKTSSLAFETLFPNLPDIREEDVVIPTRAVADTAHNNANEFDTEEFTNNEEPSSPGQIPEDTNNEKIGIGPIDQLYSKVTSVIEKIFKK